MGFAFTSHPQCVQSKVDIYGTVRVSMFGLYILSCRAPTASRIRAKILYATSKDGLRRALDGIHYELQATDPTEMGFDVIRDRAK